jgi:uncharacterized membrane protein
MATQELTSDSLFLGDFAEAARRVAPSLLHAPHASRARSIAKAISWRLLGSIDTFVVAYILTGRASLGAAISAVEVLTKLGLYYVHERGWAHIRWGVSPRS